MHGVSSQLPVGTGHSVAESRLVTAAHEFEAQMMKELLDRLVGGSTPGSDGEDSELGSNDAMGAFAGEALGRALSAHGGFGIADSVIRSLAQKGTLPIPRHEPGKLDRNTVLRTVK